MRTLQVVLDDKKTDEGLRDPLTESLLYPAFVAIALLAIHVTIHGTRQTLKRFGFLSVSSFSQDTPIVTLSAENGALRKADHISAVYRVLRLFGCLALSGLSVVDFLDLETQGEPTNGPLLKPLSGRLYIPSVSAKTTQISQIIVYSYASLLAFINILPLQKWNKVAGTHLTIEMFTVALVYTYRDIYPYATYTLKPQDMESWRLWTEIGIAHFVGFFIPLAIPREYNPIDPLNPLNYVNPEQTASWISFLTFAFLDPLIFKAYKYDHLPYSELPPLADYDRSEYLVKRSKPLLDPFFRKTRTHLFLGLMRLFWLEYIQLATNLIIISLASFIPPIALRKILEYLEADVQVAYFRPWVWITMFFVGPLIFSVSYQYYLFVTTATLVRTEGIITQLVFDHALRIRMKEETNGFPPPSTTSTPAPSRPRSPVDGELTEGERDGGSEVIGDDTLQGSELLSEGTTAVGNGKESAETPKAGPPDSNLVGRINNFIGTDLGNITGGRDFLWVVLACPIQFGISAWLLYSLLGWSAAVGVGLSVVSLPLPGYLAKLSSNVQTERMKRTDDRVQTVTETMSVIRMTKLFGWENKVNEQIYNKRAAELKLLKKRRLLNFLTDTVTYFLPLLTMAATFTCYTLIQKSIMSASIVFSSMVLFERIRESMRRCFYLLTPLIDAKVSLDRVNDFLLNTELLDRYEVKNRTDAVVLPSQTIDSEQIGFRNATFAWSAASMGQIRRQFRLRIEGELFFKPGQLNMVIGPTGCGKTSLLMALLGEMHYIPNGERAGYNLPRQGGIAYATQEAWVQNETIKENILFGKAYDEERYNNVILQCALERDLSLFEAGDETEVGEKGLTLSGGQKARVTLARAVYSDASILLLDDILAALDVHTSKFIVENCLTGDLLKGRTVILVTHNVAMVVPIADFVVSLSSDGRIATRGTIEEALKKNKKLMTETTESQEIAEKAEEDVDAIDPAQKVADNTNSSKLVVAEEVALGHISWRALKIYLGAMGGPVFWTISLVGLFATDFFNTLSSWYLGYWTSQYEGRSPSEVSDGYYLTIYSLCLLGCVVSWAISAMNFQLGSIRASAKVHQDLMSNVLGTTLRWLDTVPTARIIARCTVDIRSVDGPIPDQLLETSFSTIILLIRFGAVVLFVPKFFIPGLLVFVVGCFCAQLYMHAQLSVKREMANMKAPVLAHFGAAISGLTSIRAYGVEDAFKIKSLQRMDEYIRPARAFYNCNRWVSIRIDLIGNTLTTALAAYMVYDRKSRSAGEAGFSLSMAVVFSQLILWWIRNLNMFEVECNSLERIEAYTRIDQEPKPTEDGKPPAYWPASGALKVMNLRARYSADGPEVLHNITFEVKSGERIGVVGRTGSGKSSLTLSLLRCIPTDGDVFYDDFPTKNINLDALRSKITIIPQHPELLSGTLRENLDPFSEHDDPILNDALRAAGLFNLQEEHDEGKITLDSQISGGGGNLSVGQRQVLALARAILRRSKLLILDEATSAIDYSTDAIIQKTLRETLGDATVITVAHRLQTIMDADKIIVLDAGNLVEFDSPSNLLKKKGGYLKSLVDESGDRDRLCEMAKGAAR